MEQENEKKEETLEKEAQEVRSGFHHVLDENGEGEPFPVGAEVSVSAPPPEEEIKKEPEYLCKYTLDGEVLVEVIRTMYPEDVRYSEKPLKTVALWPLPKSIGQAQIDEMAMIHSLVRTIRKTHPNRTVPITYKEYVRSGGNQKILKQLAETGLIKMAHVAIISQATGKNTGSRLCLYYTPQGRALIREKLDPSYALTEYQ